VVAALGTGVATLQNGPSSSPPVTPQPTTTTAPTPAPSRTPDPTPDPTPGTTYLTPEGYGALRLGMTADQVRATGLASKVAAPANGMCGSFQLRDFPPRQHAVDGYISAQRGVESVFARPGVTTPEGIGPGSTVAAAKAAYPGGRQGQGHWLQSNGYLVVPLGNGLEYEFAIEGDGTVGETLVTVSRSNCFG
jgi:hypothetical protein